MAEEVTFSNCYIAYIKNQPYTLPVDTPNYDTQDITTAHATGWHILPTFLWKHFIKPINWYHLVRSYEAYKVKSTSITIFNMIPMATQIAIQGNQLFTSFNNCCYGWGYTDDLYETNIHNWWTETKNPNFFYPEGVWCAPGQTTWARYTFPLYSWRVPLARVATANTMGYSQHPAQTTWPNTTTSQRIPSGILWNPLNRPDSLQELRPGKNSMSFSWHPHECDSNIWFNLDQIAFLSPPTIYGPYCGIQRPGTFKWSDNVDPDRWSTQHQSTTPENDFTLPNLANQPIVLSSWFWKECLNSLYNKNTSTYPNNANPWMKPNLYFNGTEYAITKYPPMNHFVKLVPLLNENGTNIEFSAQVSCKVTITLDCKKRRSAIWCPTDGPYSWRQLYSHTTQDRIFAPALIRARTGGARIPWQNQTDEDGSATDGHYREDNFSNATQPNGTGVGNSRMARSTTYTTAQSPKDNLIVTFSKDSDRAVISKPTALKRVLHPSTTEAMDVQYPVVSTYM
nr:capsid protein [Mute swan feces associated chapparvovirus 3]